MASWAFSSERRNTRSCGGYSAGAQRKWAAWRRKTDIEEQSLLQLADQLREVSAFLDPIMLGDLNPETHWNPEGQTWERSPWGRVASREPEVLSAEDVGALLEDAPGFLVGGGGSALPGFQRKLTLTRRNNRWWRGNGTLPSTHILKPVSADDRPAVESENFTLGVGRLMGLVSFDTWVEQIGQRFVLVVQRYDRVTAGDTIDRIHQEDAGQALGLPWGGNEKFEVNDPSVVG